MKYLKILVFYLLIIACNKYVSVLPRVYYSKTGLAIDHLSDLYVDVPINKTKIPTNIITEINSITLPDSLLHSVDSFLFQTFIDTSGVVETVIFVSSSTNDLAKICLLALQKSSFKTQYKNGKKTPYSLLVNYSLDNDNLIPSVNNISIPESLMKRIEYDLLVNQMNYSNKTAPQFLEKATPNYPLQARQMQITGSVFVEVVIDTFGYVSMAKIKQSSNSILNHSSLEAAKKCFFEPGYIDNKKVKSKLIIPYTYSLKMEN